MMLDRKESSFLLIGIDFSAANRAGSDIWLACGLLNGDRLRVQSIFPAAQLTDPPAIQRQEALPALVQYLIQHRPRAIGLDFPFGLPESLNPEHSLIALIQNFSRYFPDLIAFERFRKQHCQWGEPKRLTDREARAPFSPLNLRVYRQTYFGIRDLLSPLLKTGRFCLPPIQPAIPQLGWLLEVCPASLLKKENLYQPYKGKSREHRTHREAIVEHFLHQGIIQLDSPSLFQSMIADAKGNALDSFLALWITFQALREGKVANPLTNATYLKEGIIFF
ncbi:MAG: hypothetical protein GXO78_05055 [Calditrichaeota bacterium]|nr:hypothetical protein [Calditrichota bacterium]